MDLRTVLDIDGYGNPCGGKCSPRAVKLPKMLIVGTKRCSSFLLTHCSCGEPDYSTRLLQDYLLLSVEAAGATTIGKSRMGMKEKDGGIEKQEALAQEQISISRSHPIAITFAWILLDAVT
ncbi:hypothetical protein V1478_008813 [Vespula squamosa]|uniref:Uncharacterized protein n=1 Tax=Vespula squamosa TaxID=30214 RepID=A0ABD2AWK1_VESSQ